MQRRNFLKNSGIAAASFAFTPATRLFAGVADTKVKIGIIGVGLRGQNHLELLLRRKDVEVAAICDISERMLASAKEMIGKTGKKMPEIFTGDVFAWKQMLGKIQLDGV
ncbi:MAG: twin-arginine translocation signal domain-containing protein, partial [Bacteroidota bacterium]